MRETEREKEIELSTFQRCTHTVRHLLLDKQLWLFMLHNPCYQISNITSVLPRPVWNNIHEIFDVPCMCSFFSFSHGWHTIQVKATTEQTLNNKIWNQHFNQSRVDTICHNSMAIFFSFSHFSQTVFDPYSYYNNIRGWKSIHLPPHQPPIPSPNLFVQFWEIVFNYYKVKFCTLYICTALYLTTNCTLLTVDDMISRF